MTYAALNGLDILAADIQNTYLTATTTEKNFIVCGPEFGLENIGRKAIFKRNLYGMKAAGRDFRNHLRDCMDHLGYTSCKADTYLSMRLSKRNDDSEYYDYMLLYVDGCLCILQHPDKALARLRKYFNLKPGSVESPNIYIGGKLSQVLLPNGVNAWAVRFEPIHPGGYEEC